MTLLDTCTLIWLSAEPQRLSKKASRHIDNPQTELWLSDASVWELSLKWQAGKLRLPQPPRLWVEEQSRLWHLRPLPIERHDLYRVSELPAHHNDPFDRLLIAQAIEQGLTILTPEPTMHRYPVATLW